MHEITLSQRALEIIEQQAQQAGARRVTGVAEGRRIFLRGSQRIDLLFELVCRGTLAEGCELHIAEQQAECWCESLPAVRATHLAARAALSAVPQRHAADCGGRRPTDSANRSDPVNSDYLAAASEPAGKETT